jgi:ATP-dependent protease ClpP protease subunit
MRNGATKVKILLSSSGGDTASAFAGYNYLHNLPIHITTYNVGTVDSAAVLLFCGGRERYALPGTRFLIHGNSLTVPPGMPLNASSLDAQLQQIKSLNQMIIQVVSATSNEKMRPNIETAVRDQTILSAEEAKAWGLVQNVRTNFMEVGDMMVALPPIEQIEKKPIQPLTPNTSHFSPVAASKP